MFNETHSFELSGNATRLLALLIDGILIGMVGGFFGLNLSVVNGLESGAISLLFGALYQWYFLTRHDGQTPGKMLMGIQVIKTDGTKISDADAVIRYVGYVISYTVVLIGFIWAFFDPKNQTWHDKLANTYVIRKPVDNANKVVTTTKKKPTVEAKPQEKIKVKNSQHNTTRSEEVMV